jgi:hypothetical protein
MLGNRQGARILQALVVLLVGCGNADVVARPECLEGPEAITRALEQAPGEVRLDGRTRLSACFKQAASESDVQSVGVYFLTATQGLADRVRTDPHSDAAVQLGYLVAAVRRGARTDTGVHFETTRRIEQELRGLRTDTPEFRRGLAAGRRSG